MPALTPIYPNLDSLKTKENNSETENNEALTDDAPFNGENMSKETNIINKLANRALDTANFAMDFGKALISSKDNPSRIEVTHGKCDEFIVFNNIGLSEVEDALKKAIDENDYSGLNEIVSNMGKSTQEENTTLDQPDYGLSYRSIDYVQENKVDTPIDEEELDSGELGHFCSSILELNKKLVHHKNAREKIIERASKKENGSKNYSVREIVLLAIAANDKLTENYKDMLLVEKLDENLEELLIGVGGQRYIEVLLERLETELKNNYISPWYDTCKTLEMALSIKNQECTEAILNKFKDTDAEYGDILSCQPSMSSKLLHYAIHNNYTDVAEFIVEHGFVDINSVDNNGYTPLYHAVACDNLKLVKLLIKNGANVDAQSNREGRTALHIGVGLK